MKLHKPLFLAHGLSQKRKGGGVPRVPKCAMLGHAVDPPIRTASPKSAHFKGFWELAWANMGQVCLKIAFNHLLEHNWSKNNFGKNHF